MPSGAVVASMAGAAGMAATKFAAAAVSGSSGMFAEGVRSTVNSCNSALMALGQRRSRKPPDELHPFGYGKELYFWTLVVATALFVVGGGVTVAKGVLRVMNPPEELTNVGWSYAVLALATFLAGYGWWKAFREFRAGQGNRTFRRGVKKAKDPTTLTVLFDSSASLVGLAVTFLGLVLAQWFEAPAIDGVASIIVGLLMATVAGGLVYQSKQLLVGESATAELKAAVCERVEQDDAVAGVDELLTMHLSPEQVLAVAVVRFRGELSAGEVGEAVGRIEKAVRDEYPEVTRVFIHPARWAAAGRRESRGRVAV